MTLDVCVCFCFLLDALAFSAPPSILVAILSFWLPAGGRQQQRDTRPVDAAVQLFGISDAVVQMILVISWFLSVITTMKECG